MICCLGGLYNEHIASSRKIVSDFQAQMQRGTELRKSVRESEKESSSDTNLVHLQLERGNIYEKKVVLHSIFGANENATNYSNTTEPEPILDTYSEFDVASYSTDSGFRIERVSDSHN